jgi:hypothetical protein
MKLHQNICIWEKLNTNEPYTAVTTTISAPLEREQKSCEAVLQWPVSSDASRAAYLSQISVVERAYNRPLTSMITSSD